MIYIVGNWKMNKKRVEAIDFAKKLTSFLKDDALKNCSVLIAPPSLFLPFLTHENFALASQNIAFENFGAYTGELSISMLSEYVTYTLLGHSERRLYFNETDSALQKKLTLSLRHNVTPIFCFGESKQDRNSGHYLSVIEDQLSHTIMQLTDNDISGLLLAYEPVWAIGTGENASPDQIAEVHSYVRGLLEKRIGFASAQHVPILYGGSCSSKNAKVILTQLNVNGLLIGGASLDVNHFYQIIQIANNLN